MIYCLYLLFRHPIVFQTPLEDGHNGESCAVADNGLEMRFECRRTAYSTRWVLTICITGTYDPVRIEQRAVTHIFLLILRNK